MADLESLIRVRKHTVEQRQKVLADMYRKDEGLRDEKDKMQAQFLIEQEKVKDMPPDMQGFFVAYSKSVKHAVEEIDLKRQHLAKQIEGAREQMRIAFAELKKVEIIDERRAAEFAAEIKKKEDALMDEMAIDAYRRKGD